MENYTIEFINAPFKYQEDIIEFFIKNNATINPSDQIFYSHNLEVTNKFFSELKEVFKNPHKFFKENRFKNISNDFIKGNLIVLEIDFHMIKYNNEDCAKVLLETNKKTFIEPNMLKLLEPYIESEKHYLLKFSRNGLQKVKVNS